MKLLLFSDVHADASACRTLVQLSKQADVVVAAGDFGNMRRSLSTCIDALRRITTPMVAVAGNNESTEELQDACRSMANVHVLHGSSATLGGATFFGVGGGIPVTPFGAWSYDFSEEQAATMLAQCPQECVLVTHSPPHGAGDVDGGGRSRGSTAIRDAILRVKPLLVVCGHIHASAGRTYRVESTPVVNAGPTGILWDLDAGRQA